MKRRLNFDILLEKAKVGRKLELINHRNLSFWDIHKIHAAIDSNPNLTTLNLQGTRRLEQIAEKMCDSLAKTTSLKKLNLWDTFPAKISYVLSSFLQSNTTITDLNIGKNQIKEYTNIVSPLVTNNTTLKCLILKSNALGDDGAFGIAVDLSVNTSLTSLSLAFNNIHHEGIANIVEALKVNTTLRNLNISGNKFGVDGAYQIASLLENNSTLKKLNLSASDLNDVGLHKILQSLEKNTTLKELKLQNLDNDINNSVEYLVFLLKTKCHLTKLNLRFNLFTPQNLSLLIETLRHSTTLTSVDLSGQNKFTLEKAEEIESVIQTNSTLTSLSLNDNNIDNAICQPIIRGLCCNTSLRELHLSGNQVYDIQGLLGHLHKNSTLTLLNLKDNKKFNRDDNNLVCSFMAINKTLSHDLGLIAKWPRSHESLDIVEQKEIEELLHVLRIYLPIDLQVQSITLLLKIKKYKKYKKAKKNVITNALY